MDNRQNWKKIAYSFVLLFGITVSVQSQNQNSEDPWFFVQLTDPQFGMFENNQSFEKETVLYEKAVESINRLQPDFIVITGDFVHDQNSEAQINEFKRLNKKLDSNIKILLVPGNHDVGKTPTKESLKKYKKNYGPDHFEYNHKGCSLIGFNSSLMKGHLEKEVKQQRVWLEKKLSKAKDSPHLFLFCHYPFFIKTIDEPTSYGNMDIEFRLDYLEMFDKYNVDAVFSGHHHNTILNTYEKTELVTTGAAGKPLGKSSSGFRIIKVYKNKIEHAFYAYENLPQKVTYSTSH